MSARLQPRRAHPVAGDLGVTGSLAAVVHGTTSGLVAVAALLEAQPTQHFTALVSGSLAFGGGRKGGDLVAIPLGVVVGILVGIAVAKGIRTQPNPRRQGAMATQLLWWACPGGVAVGALVFGARLQSELAAVTVAAGLLMSAQAVLSRRAGTTFPPRALSASVLGCLLWVLVPGAVVVALTRTSSGVADVVDGVPWLVAPVAFGCAAVLYELWNSWRGRIGPHPATRLFVLVPQCAMPLLVLAFCPARLRLPDGSAASYAASPLLLVACWVLAVAGVAACLLRLRNRHAVRDREEAPRLLSPAAVLPMLLVAMLGVTRPPAISADDYHYGETLIGWFRYRMGDLPYVDHQPAHGLVQDDAAAFLASVFFDGSAASHTEAVRLLSALVAALVFAVVLWASGSQLLAGVSTLLAAAPLAVASPIIGGLTWAFLIAVGWLLVAPRLRARPRWWLPVWVVATPLLVLAAPAQGLVLALAAGALAVRSVADALGRGGVRQVVPGLVAGAVVALASLVTPLGAMLVAALGYVVGNAGINAAAYGIPWDPALVGGAGAPFLADLMRMSWVVGLVLCSLVALSEVRAGRWRSEVLARAVFLAVFLGGVLPYVMGRVDGQGVSRAGMVTAFVLALVVPVLVWERLRPAGRATLALGFLTLSAALFGVSAQPVGILTAAQPFVASAHLVDGDDVGLPGWGRGAPVDPGGLDQTIRLGRILDEQLEPGETYYDATSRNAQYYYLGLPPVVSVAAAYNTPLPADQRQTIRELRQAEPQTAVLLQPLGNQVHDGGGLALRTPLLTRYLERAYTPYQRDGFILGHRGRGVPETADQSVVLEIDDTSDAEFDRGVSRTTTAIRLADPTAATFLDEGTPLVLPDGTERRITSTSAGGVLELDAAVPDDLRVADQRGLTVSTGDVDRRMHRAWLFERSFGQVDLQRLPASWGGSLGSIDGVSRVSQVAGSGRLDSASTSLRVSLPEDSGDADLVSLDVACDGDVPAAAAPVVHVSWESEGTLTDAPGRTFVAVPGTQLVPLDSSAFWRASPGADALTFTVVDARGCAGMDISDLALWERDS